jgi:hypothetical protein
LRLSPESFRQFCTPTSSGSTTPSKLPCLAVFSVWVLTSGQGYPRQEVQPPGVERLRTSPYLSSNGELGRGHVATTFLYHRPALERLKSTFSGNNMTAFW